MENGPARMGRSQIPVRHIVRGTLHHTLKLNPPRTQKFRHSPVGARAAFIEPGSPWENGHCETFNSKLHDEFLNGELFYSLAEARIIIKGWRQHYNTLRPHSSLGYRPPAPLAVV